MALDCGTDFKGVISTLIVQLPILNHAHSMPYACVNQQGLFCWVYANGKHILGKHLTPAPLLLPLSPAFLSIWTCSVSTGSFLPAALSAAQQGTNSLLIGTYLGKGRNPIFLNNSYSLPLPSCTCKKNFQASLLCPFFSSIVELSLIPLCHPLRWTSLKRTGGGCIFR